MIPVVSVVGYSNSGKTTFVVKLVLELKSRGLRVAVIKHHHKPVDIDIPGKDTWKHAQAGADIVVSASPGKLAIIETLNAEMPLNDILEKINAVDIIITEGFKREKYPKVEVFRSQVHTELITPPEQLIAVVSDAAFSEIPSFDLEDAAGVADLLQEKLSLPVF